MKGEIHYWVGKYRLDIVAFERNSIVKRTFENANSKS